MGGRYEVVSASGPDDMKSLAFREDGLDLASGSLTGATLFLESLLEEYCTVYTKDESSSRMLFEALRKKFSQWSLLPSNPMPPGVRAKHRHHLRNVVRLVMQQISQNLDENGTEGLMPEAEVDRKSVLSPIRELPELYLERQVLATSRFEAEYGDVEYIAKGGFGRVYKACHLLDGNTYAVKTVLIKNGDQSRVSKTLREIQTLSRLHHPNVVSYKNAWLEVNPSECPDGKVPKIVELSSESQSSLPPCPDRRQPSLKDKSGRPRNFQGGLLLEKLKPLMIPESESSSEFSFEFCESRENEEEMKSFDTSASLRGKGLDRIKPVLPTLNLYIAMQFCDGTLREWLRRRNSSSSAVEASVNLGIFAQILEGLVYIHENGIIHRDLKPENIFFNQSTRRVQIGDFGLARYLGGDGVELALTPHVVALPSMEGLRLTRGLGTHSYAAPEQMAGGNYGYKCDIYSLGYVLVELFEKHFTDVSRSKCFQDLRNGVVPSSIAKHWPIVGELVGEMLDRLPELRPSAAEVHRRVEEMKRVYADSVTHYWSRALLDSTDE